MRFVIIGPAELAGLVPILITALPGTIGVVSAFLIGRIVIHRATLIGVVGIDTTLLNRSIDVALGRDRPSERDEDGSNGDWDQLGRCIFHSNILLVFAKRSHDCSGFAQPGAGLFNGREWFIPSLKSGYSKEPERELNEEVPLCIAGHPG
jgi:hypothetical protein